jgi:hypothetical protein
MRRIIGEKACKLCVDLCQRMGDEYDGPYMVSTGHGKSALTFSGKKGSYTAVPTEEGLSIRDEKGVEIALFNDLKDVSF